MSTIIQIFAAFGALCFIVLVVAGALALNAFAGGGWEPELDVEDEAR